MLNDTWFAVLNLSLEIKIMFHYTTVELQIFDDNCNCLFYSLAIKPPKKPLFQCFCLHLHFPHGHWCGCRSLWAGGGNKWLPETSSPWITLSVNTESTISFSAKQNYKHLNLFWTGMKKQNLPWILCTEKSVNFHLSIALLGSSSSTASRALSISVLH